MATAFVAPSWCLGLHACLYRESSCPPPDCNSVSWFVKTYDTVDSCHFSILIRHLGHAPVSDPGGLGQGPEVRSLGGEIAWVRLSATASILSIVSCTLLMLRSPNIPHFPIS